MPRADFLLFKFFRRNTFVLSKCLRKITHITKAAIECRFGDRFAVYRYLKAGAFYSQAVDIVGRGVTGKFAEETAEILFVDVGYLGEV